MAVRFTILGSGSGGNCAYLETDETRFLIDAGFSGKQIRERLASIGRTPETLTGVLVTHEHTDHTQGLKVLCSKYKLPVYCNRLTKEAIENQLGFAIDCRLFGTGTSFELGDVGVDSFSVPHDAYDPVGFLLHTAHGKIGFLTDLGHATKAVIHRVREARVLVLEANHDVKMLQDDTKRPWATKQRILSRHGHLSNAAAGEVLSEVLSDAMESVYLGHLSRDCNSPELARETVGAAIDRLGVGARRVALHDTSQRRRSPTLTLHAGVLEYESTQTGEGETVAPLPLCPPAAGRV